MGRTGHRGNRRRHERGLASRYLLYGMDAFATGTQRERPAPRIVQRTLDNSARARPGQSQLVRSSSDVVIELMTGKFQPEYAGNFYVAPRRRYAPARASRPDCPNPDLRHQERPQRPAQPRTLHLTHGRRRLHLRQTSSQHWNGPNPMQLLTLPNGETANDALTAGCEDRSHTLSK
jgi:hypothetical protein